MEEVNESKKAYKKASVAELKRLLKKGKVAFKYEKRDGSERKANGTLKNSLIPKIDRADKRADSTSDDVTAYYDLDKSDWRSFVNDNLIGIKDEK